MYRSWQGADSKVPMVERHSVWDVKVDLQLSSHMYVEYLKLMGNYTTRTVSFYAMGDTFQEVVIEYFTDSNYFDQIVNKAS